MSKTKVAKSVRLSSAEAKELAQLSKQVATTEAALMKKWIHQGIQGEKLELAIRAYMQRKTDLRGGAAMAGISYNRFLREVQARNIFVLEEQGFLDRLHFLADAFDDENLRAAVAKAMEQPG